MINTVISLELIDKQDDNHFEGEFKLAAPDLGVSKVFAFTISHPWDEAVHLVIAKDGDVLLEQRGELTRETVRQYSFEQKVVLTAFTALFRAYRGQLSEIGLGKKAAEIATPIQSELHSVLRAVCS